MIHPAAQADPYDEAQERAQRGTRQFLLARVSVVAFGYIATLILTRKLGPTDYGIYGIVLSQLVWLEMSANAGAVGAIAKLIANNRHDPGEVERSGRALLFGLAVLLFCVCWLMAPHVASWMQIPNGLVLFRIAIVDLPFAAFFASYDGILMGRRHFGMLASAHAIYGFTKLAGVIALIGFGFSLERVLVLSVLSTFVVCLMLTVRYPPRGFRPTVLILREITAISAPMAVYIISAQVLVNLDLWLLKGLWKGGGEVIGHYVASMSLAKFLMVISVAQAGVLFASVAVAVGSQNAARAQRHIQDATRFAMIIAAAALVILGLNATEVLSVLYSRAYADGQLFLPFQLAGVALFALLDAFAQALMAAGRQRFVASALLATLPIAWLSNYLLIPWLGPLGAAVSMLLGMSLGAALTGAAVYHQFGSLIQSATLLRVVIAATAVGLVSSVWPASGPLVILKVALLGGLYLLVLRLLGEITANDFRLTRRIQAEHSV